MPPEWNLETMCDLLNLDSGRVSVPGGELTSGTLRRSARSYARGFAEQGYPAGSLVLLALTCPLELLGVTFGAWWVGHRVTYVRSVSPSRRDDIALARSAAVQICDPTEITDDAERHRDVPAIPPRELALAPVSWSPRCSRDDVAIEAHTSAGVGGPSYAHADLLADAWAHAAGLPGARAGRHVPPGGASGSGLVRCVAAALLWYGAGG